MCTARPRAARFALTQLADQIEVTGQLLPLWFCFDSRGRLMATITYVSTINRVAKKLGEYPELLQAIVSNDDNLYGSVIRAPERAAARGLRHPSLQAAASSAQQDGRAADNIHDAIGFCRKSCFWSQRHAFAPMIMLQGFRTALRSSDVDYRRTSPAVW